MTRVWLAMSLMENLLEFVNIYRNIQQTPILPRFLYLSNTIDKLKLWNFCTQIPSQKCTRQRVSTDVSFHKLIKLFFVSHPLPPTFSIFSFCFCLVFFLFVTLSWYPPFHLSLLLLLFISLHPQFCSFNRDN